MLHLPILRGGQPYRSCAVQPLTDVRTGEAVAEVSQANAGLIARDLTTGAVGAASLARLDVARLLAICRAAGAAFHDAVLPVGDEEQGPEDYVRQLSATTGMPGSLARANMAKIRYVLDEMETVLSGLTRGLDLAVLDRGHGRQGACRVSFRRQTEVLGAVLPGNSPGVHSLWLPAVALKVGLALKPGAREPWTPMRIAQALLASGCPADAIGVYPTDHSGATELLLRCGRSMVFGDRTTVAPWADDPRVEVHGPGWSKVVLGEDAPGLWRRHLDLIVDSVAANGGRSCVNASGVWTCREGREIAEALAERLVAVEARRLDDPKARLAAFPDRGAARRLSEEIDRQLEIPGAVDLTAALRRQGRVVELDGCAFLLPTVILCTSSEHPLARSEFLFPFVTVVEVSRACLVPSLGDTLVATALTEDAALIAELLEARHVDRLNIGPLATSTVAWDQPHEGNLFEHLYHRRAYQAAPSAVEGTRSAAPVA
jgi:acyl-CoA reductase-like NAD-dependent aldehyde dehydrogenase